MSKIDTELPDGRKGFRRGRGTRVSLCGLGIIGELGLQMQQDVFIGFIDYEKAFDTVSHGMLANILKKIGIDEAYIRLISSLYWNQEA